MVRLFIIFSMVIPLPFWQSSASNKVATPTLEFAPDPAEISIDVSPGGHYDLPVSCATVGSHIFWTKDGSMPTHSGDVATGTSTSRLGASSGTIAIPLGHKIVVAIGYLSSLPDSDPISQRYYIFKEGG